VRLLTQASFGADDASIQAVRNLGLAAWTEGQFSRPQTLRRPYIEAAIAAGAVGASESVYGIT
jgi:hypothetical protein